jgi:hypothetical protein
VVRVEADVMSVGPSDKFVAALEQVRQRAEGPYITPGDFDNLIALLQTMFCEHEYELKRMGGPPDSECSNEQASVCKKCGAER